MEINRGIEEERGEKGYVRLIHGARREGKRGEQKDSKM
jgi:hypothetical protein